MKIAVSYPPLTNPKGFPLLAQNRQFHWFKSPTYIYPMVPAYMATMLKRNGCEVLWDDAIAQEMNYAEWMARLVGARPDVVVMESKTPVIKRHWEIIAEIKERLPETRTILVGDHPTALPRESMEHCPVDFVVTGGDYDFMVNRLCQVLMDAPKTPGLQGQWLDKHCSGIWYRRDGEIRSTGSFHCSEDLNSLPFIDRDLTQWQLYASKNGNFKHKPGTYTMAARDCWWGRCNFCSWTTLYPKGTYRSVSVERHLDEIGLLIEKVGVREIFDDSGCFPRGAWLEEFCRGMVERGYHRKVTLGCNMRVGGVTPEQFALMKKANFRFILMGLESINQSTLNRLHKGVRVRDIMDTCRAAKDAGLEPHMTVMVGYPWEGKEDAEETIAFTRELFRKGLIDTLQATIVIPYPGTPLFKEARENGWLLTEDWECYDMKESVWNSPVSPADVKGYVRTLYGAALTPRFLLRKLASMRDWDDFSYLLRAGWKLINRMRDFHSEIRSWPRRT